MKIFLALLLFITPLFGQIVNGPVKTKHKYTLSIASIFQQEGRFLKEWIDYHLLQGVDHFYLYNNNSSDNYEEVLQPYIADGTVELIDWPSEEKLSWVTAQEEALEDMVSRSKKTTRWLCFLDIDEFIVPYQHGDLKEFLESHEEYGQVVLMWRYFGTSHVQKIPEGKLLLETLLYRKKFTPGEVVQAKAIVKPRLVAKPHVHECDMVKNTTTKRYDDGLEEYPAALVHHYWTRDIEFLTTVKRERQERLLNTKWDDKKIQEMIDLYNDVVDETMLKYCKYLR